MKIDHTAGAPVPPARRPLERLLTRREAADYIRGELGRPLTYSTLMKLCALGEGPPVAEKWGRRVLYRRGDLDVWVAGRTKRTSGEVAA
jgi:hypothetical protein